MTTAEQAASRIVQQSWPRLIAYLVGQTRSIQLAEDCLSEAVTAALETWPSRGVPDNPEAWLMVVARRHLIGRLRRQEVAARNLPALKQLSIESQEAHIVQTIPDRRLELMFVCAHPAIDESVRSPLMLQAVLGIDAATIAGAFLVKGPAMGQRLSRAKRKIEAAGIPFRIPAADDLPERTGFVLDAIYAAYGTGWDSEERAGLASEAIRLGEILVDVRPDDAEVHGLLALMLHAGARAQARRDEHGSFVPLLDQDESLWHREMIEEADRHLRIALELRSIGTYQLQAAIQAAHNARRPGGSPDWEEIDRLYQGLVAIAPSIGATVAAVAARLHLGRVDSARRQLEDLDSARVEDYQPYWVVHAEVLELSGSPAEAARSLERAIRLTDDAAVRAHLEEKRARLAEV